MGAALKTRVVKIGNSRGLRIPKALLEQTGIRDEVELTVEGAALVVRPLCQVRVGWEERFAEMHDRGDDRLLSTEYLPTRFDDEDWEW